MQLWGSNISMGMDGFISVFAAGGTHYPHCLLDSSFQVALKWWPPSLPFFTIASVINKDRKVWYAGSDGNSIRFSVFSEHGIIHSQFQAMGVGLKGMVTDTSGNVFVIFRDANPGFGVMRFSTGFSPDFSKRVNSNVAVTDVKWGIDQRLYVSAGTDIFVLDRNGNLLKMIQNVPQDYTVYPDHGLGIVSYTYDSVYVARTDSNLAVHKTTM
jgi:hypothetical protein